MLVFLLRLLLDINIPQLMLRKEKKTYGRKKMIEGLDITRDNIVEVIMKDTSTFKNDPERLKKWVNIARNGEDVRVGNTVLSNGTRVRAQETGILAAVGKSNVKVHATPSVGIISTGDELVEINRKPKPWQIRNSNSYSLAAQARQTVTDVEILGRVNDKKIFTLIEAVDGANLDAIHKFTFDTIFNDQVSHIYLRLIPKKNFAHRKRGTVLTRMIRLCQVLPSPFYVLYRDHDRCRKLSQPRGGSNCLQNDQRCRRQRPPPTASRAYLSSLPLNSGL